MLRMTSLPKPQDPMPTEENASNTTAKKVAPEQRGSEQQEKTTLKDTKGVHSTYRDKRAAFDVIHEQLLQVQVVNAGVSGTVADIDPYRVSKDLQAWMTGENTSLRVGVRKEVEWCVRAEFKCICALYTHGHTTAANERMENIVKYCEERLYNHLRAVLAAIETQPPAPSTSIIDNMANVLLERRRQQAPQSTSGPSM